jgi:hypothetical protein
MSCADKFNATRKLRVGEREKKRERENGQKGELGHLHLAVFRSAKKAKTLFLYIDHNSSEN